MALVDCIKCHRLISEQCDRCGFCGASQKETESMAQPTDIVEIIEPQDDIHFSLPDLKKIDPNRRAAPEFQLDSNPVTRKIACEPG